MLDFLNEALATLTKGKAPLPKPVISDVTLAQLGKLSALMALDPLQPEEMALQDPDILAYAQAVNIKGPSELHVFATNRCQLACTFCPGQSAQIAPNLSQQLTKRELDLDTFRYVWQQYPSLRSVVFSGWGEPLLNPQVLAMADHAWQDRQAPATLFTNGLLLEIHQEILLMSEGLTLVVSLNGHSPSAYRTCTGMDPGNFSTVCEQVRWLIQQRQKRRLKQHDKQFLQVELSFIVGAETLAAVPAMVELAQELGVDGIRLNNIAASPQLNPQAVFDQPLYQDNPAHRERLGRVQAKSYPLPIVWPVAAIAESNQNRACQAPYNTLTLDGDCTIGNCAMFPLSPTHEGASPTIIKGWEAGGWTSDPLQRLREVHSADSLLPIPMACRSCTHNCGKT